MGANSNEADVANGLAEGANVRPKVEADADAADGDVAEAVLDVPVLVRVELATVTISARELATLAAGDVLALGVQPKGLVALRVDGVVVGRGELVDIDGELGVRLHSGGSPSMARR